MILDKENIMSNDQAITTTAASTDLIDLGLTEMGEGEPIEVICQVTTAFAGGTSIDAALQTDDNASFSSATQLQATGAIATATLVQGYRFKFSVLPEDCERYLRINYTVVGTMSAGNILAGLALDRDTWKALPDAI